jgi:DNA-binding NtrC family response regulator
VDKLHETRSFTKLLLSNFGYVVHSFPDAEDALGSFDPEIHDLVVTDQEMAGISGQEMAHIIKMRSPSTPVVMYSGVRPADCSCLDVVVEKSASLTVLKDAVEKFLAGGKNPSKPCLNGAPPRDCSSIRRAATR